MNTQEDKYSIAVNQDGMVLESVPKHLRTPQLCMDAVKNDGWALEFVPENIKTEEMCRMVLKPHSNIGFMDYEVLDFIPFPSVCLEGLKMFSLGNDPLDVFSYINPKIMTDEIAKCGIEMDSTCLVYIPQHLRTPEIYNMAVEKNGTLLRNIPEEERTKELCETAVRSDFRSLQSVPEKMRTTELCMQALKEDAFAIQYFPADKLTREVCLTALETASHIRILSFIPFKDIQMKAFNDYCKDYSTTRDFLQYTNPKVMNQELAMKIFTKAPDLFYNIPNKFKNKRLCEEAVKLDGSNLKHILDSHKTKELCEMAIKQSPYAIPYILNEMKGTEQYREMVDKNPQNLQGIPQKERSYEMCKAALDNTFGKDSNDISVVSSITFPSLLLEVFKAHDNPEKINLLLNIVSRDAITPEIAKEAMVKDGRSLHLIPEKAITPEVAEIAVKNYPSSLQWVPARMRTPDMILFTIKEIEGYNIHVPDNIKNGNNIYSFHKKVEDIINKPLSYGEHKKLYAGESILVGTVRTHGGAVMEDCRLIYNRDTNSLHLKKSEKQQESKMKEPQRQLQKMGQKPKGRKL